MTCPTRAYHKHHSETLPFHSFFLFFFFSCALGFHNLNVHYIYQSYFIHPKNESDSDPLILPRLSQIKSDPQGSYQCYIFVLLSLATVSSPDNIQLVLLLLLYTMAESYLHRSLSEILRHPSSANTSHLENFNNNYSCLSLMSSQDDSLYWIDEQHQKFCLAFPAILDLKGRYSRMSTTVTNDNSVDEVCHSHG